MGRPHELPPSLGGGLGGQTVGPSWSTLLVSRRSGPPESPLLVPDEDQQRVIDYRDGPLLVLAGPGTGKTATVVELVADRVERHGLRPEQILVLTFSRRAADELRFRLASRLQMTVQGRLAWTFHAWCYAVVRGSRSGFRRQRAATDVRAGARRGGPRSAGAAAGRHPAVAGRLGAAARAAGFCR